MILAGCLWPLWVGKYTHFEKFLSILVALMGASFLVSMFILVDSPALILSGLGFDLPEGEGSFINLAAIAGTTCGAMVFIMRSIVVAEKGWNAGNWQRG